MALDPNKTRILVTVRKSTIGEFRDATKALGISRNVLSEVVEDALIKITKIFKLAKEKGITLSIVDLFTMIGEEMEEMKNEVVQEEEINKGENLCPKCGLPLHKFHNCELNPTAEGKGNSKSPRKTKGMEKKPRR